MDDKPKPALPKSRNDKGFTRVIDDNGKHLCNGITYNGRMYSAWGGNLALRLDEYKKSFRVYDDDIYLVAYPKSGTHWLWEVLMMLTRGSAESRTENKLEQHIEHGFDVEEEVGLDLRPRVLNSHLHPDDMPTAIMNNKKGKFIQIHRNPADVAVSFFYHLSNDTKGTEMNLDWNEYLAKLFCEPKLMPDCTWFDYTSAWLSYQHQKCDNFLSVYYEDFQQDPMAMIRKLVNFIGVKVDEELLNGILISTSFKAMKQREGKTETLLFAENYSMYRKGIVGDWKNNFTTEQRNKFIAYFNENMKDYPELLERYNKYMAM